MYDRLRLFITSLAAFLAVAGCHGTARHEPLTGRVGPRDTGGTVVATGQVVRPAGTVLEYPGRPVDLLASPDGRRLYVKDRDRLAVIDAATMQLLQEVPYSNGGASMHGLAMNAAGSRLYVTTTGSALHEMLVSAEDGTLNRGRTIKLTPEVRGRKEAYPCGMALSADGHRAYVCLSMNNTLAVVELEEKQPAKEIPVGVAPYGVVLSPDGGTAYVTNWGGRHPKAGERSARSAGTPTLIDERGAGSSGTLGVVDLAAGRMVKEIATGLHPAQVISGADGGALYVANANSDSVSVIDTGAGAVTATINVRPHADLPFGSAANALALSRDERTLFVANGGNNAVAVVSLDTGGKVAGFIPAGWYPGALAVRGDTLFVANVKGIGSRDRDKKKDAFNSRRTVGSIQRVQLPDPPTLRRYTGQVTEDALVPQSLRAWERAQTGRRPVPVPERAGEPSVFEHVVYVIKENRTYDQVFGDIGKGNSDPKLCIYGRDATPNQHALAEQFALLDNFYCNGVLSADGHAWATEGSSVDYLEKSFGGWARSYPFGAEDPLAIAPTGFVWDNVLLHNLSFRNYGEMASTSIKTPKQTWTSIYQDFTEKAGKVQLVHSLPTDLLKTYTCPASAGWNLQVSDQIRADAFLNEFAEHQKKGDWPNFVMIYLPQDHTSGTSPGQPKPASMVADNDLALGRIVDAISHSAFWATTCIFVIEDDPQDGFDHVDGHRSTCQVISPYTKRNAVVSEFYNQTSVLHTIELILGLPPMNQMDAMAPAMRACFTAKPDLTPYTLVPNRVPIDDINPPKQALRGKALDLAEKSLAQEYGKPDMVNEDEMNRILWHASRGDDAPYPAAFAGAHGKGLEALHLKLDGRQVGRDDDDDDD